MDRVLDSINGLSAADFAAEWGSLYESSPWIAERAAEARPFGSRDEMLAAFREATERAGETERLALLAAHPDLAGNMAGAERLTPESAAEQSAAGLDTLTEQDRATFHELNVRYRKHFSFPFILCAREHPASEILTIFRERLGNERNDEVREALRQVHRIARHRALAKWEERIDG